MTQKELLYVEDAVKHENNIIKICNESINMLENEDLITFLEKEVKKHNSMKEKLISLLEECNNEWWIINGKLFTYFI